MGCTEGINRGNKGFEDIDGRQSFAICAVYKSYTSCKGIACLLKTNHIAGGQGELGGERGENVWKLWNSCGINVEALVAVVCFQVANGCVLRARR